jgi:hypothetical protein
MNGSAPELEGVIEGVGVLFHTHIYTHIQTHMHAHVHFEMTHL